MPNSLWRGSHAIRLIDFHLLGHLQEIAFQLQACETRVVARLNDEEFFVDEIQEVVDEVCAVGMRVELLYELLVA